MLLAIMAISINACEQINLEDCFEPLNGTWVRLNSNNSSNDCMKVVISGDVAVLFANPKNVSWVDEGDNLWQEITHVKALQEYEIKVLGSDEMYYDAILELEDANTIKVTIDAAGAGNEQEWVRVGASEVLPECEISDINGSWTRISSNNASLDGMRIKLLNEEANVSFLTASATSYTVGDVLWRKINSIPGGDTFVLEVLGSDDLYYEAKLKRTSDDRMELTIDSSGNGNAQIWER